MDTKSIYESLPHQPTQRPDGGAHAVGAAEAARAPRHMQVRLQRQVARVLLDPQRSQQLRDGAVALARRTHATIGEQGILDMHMHGVVGQQRPRRLHRAHADLHKVGGVERHAQRRRVDAGHEVMAALGGVAVDLALVLVQQRDPRPRRLIDERCHSAQHLVAELGGAPLRHIEREDANIVRAQRLRCGDRSGEPLLLILGWRIDRRFAHRAADRRDAEAPFLQHLSGLRKLFGREVDHIDAPSAAQLKVMDILRSEQIQLFAQVCGDLVAEGAERERRCRHTQFLWLTGALSATRPTDAHKLQCFGGLLGEVVPAAFRRDARIVTDGMQALHKARVIVATHPRRTATSIGHMHVAQQRPSRHHRIERFLLQFEMMQIGEHVHPR